MFQMTNQYRESIKNALKLYFIMGSTNCHNIENSSTVLEKAIEGGITLFQFREKGRVP